MDRFLRIADVAALRAYLEQQENPRLQMLLFVSVAGASGVLTDWALLRLGLGRMAVRYSLAVLLAYVPFLGLLRWWLGTQGVRTDGQGLLVPGPEDAVDGVELGADLVNAGPPAPRGFLATGEESSLGGGSGLDLPVDGDLGEGTVVVIVLVAAAGLVLAVGYLVWQAPAILAEVMLDGALSAGLYRRLRGVDPGSFLGTAFRKTFPAFALSALLVGVAGWAIQAHDPDARTLRGAWSHGPAAGP